MPKGKKQKDFPPPSSVYCDFCGTKFAPTHWQQRTCPSCKKQGAPSQENPRYEGDVEAWLKLKYPKRKKKRRKS